MQSDSSDHKTNLNIEQEKAIKHNRGPLLILAGAGTGKTKTLIERILRLINNEHVSPKKILAITFTNKAAKEMKERCSMALEEQAVKPRIQTFHGAANTLLKQYGFAINITDFVIIDAKEQLGVIKEALSSTNLPDREKYTSSYEKRILNQIQIWKNNNISPTDITITDHEKTFTKHAVETYSEYQNRLSAINAMDFGDLIMNALRLFCIPDIANAIHTSYPYLMVDEYQDTNDSQRLFIKALAGSHNNVCCVGDDDQSIYGWRGAKAENMLQFEADFPGATIIKLEQNYRSASNIVRAAAGVIAHNENRMRKKIWSDISMTGDLEIRNFIDAEQEALAIILALKSLERDRGTMLKEAAILVRSGSQTRVLEEACVRHRLPYRMIGSVRFYDREEIKDILAYASLVYNPRNNLALYRIINKPRRGVGKKTEGALRSLVEPGESDLEAIFRLIKNSESSFDKLRKFAILMQELISKKNNLSPSEMLLKIFTESGYRESLDPESEKDLEKIDNIEELIESSSDFSSMSEFLDKVTLENDLNVNSDNIDINNALNIMTIHAAKGLEFDYVFLPAWEEGLFPNQMSLDEKNGLEEERRLAYVAITRARKGVFISFVSKRILPNIGFCYMQPSRFIKEIPIKEITVSDIILDDTKHKVQNSSRNANKTTHQVFKTGQKVWHPEHGKGLVMKASSTSKKVQVLFPELKLLKVNGEDLSFSPVPSQ